MREADDFFDQFLRLSLRIEKDMAQAFNAGQDNRKGELQHDGADSAAKDDHGCRRLDNLGKLPALDEQAGQYPSDGNQQSSPTALVQVQDPTPRPQSTPLAPPVFRASHLGPPDSQKGEQALPACEGVGDRIRNILVTEGQACVCFHSVGE